ncbi:MAG: kelch repeat-containing protein [Pseudomonadota bacterium]
MKARKPHLLLQQPERRPLLLAGLLSPILAACGGGGSNPGGPGTPGPRGSFTVLGSQFIASQHTASSAPDGSVVIIGGSRGESTLSAHIDRFVPASSSFVRIGDLANGRSTHRATTITGGAILVTGGLRSSGNSREAELVDPGTGAVRMAGTMSVSRIDHSAVQLADGRVFVAGGYSTGERAPLGISDSAEIWDPATQAFRRLSQRMAVPRAAHTATLLPSGKVLLAGGYSWGPTYTFAELFDPATETFTPVADNSPARASHAAHIAADGRVLLIGGETVGADGLTVVPLASVLSFDPGSGALRAQASLQAPRTWAASVRLSSGEVVLFGGQQQMSTYSSTVESYDPAQGASVLTALDTDRALHTATLLPGGRVLILGGEGSAGAYRPTVLVYRAS